MWWWWWSCGDDDDVEMPMLMWRCRCWWWCGDDDDDVAMVKMMWWWRWLCWSWCDADADGGVMLMLMLMDGWIIIIIIMLDGFGFTPQLLCQTTSTFIVLAKIVSTPCSTNLRPDCFTPWITGHKNKIVAVPHPHPVLASRLLSFAPNIHTYDMSGKTCEQYSFLSSLFAPIEQQCHRKIKVSGHRKWNKWLWPYRFYVSNYLDCVILCLLVPIDNHNTFVEHLGFVLHEHSKFLLLLYLGWWSKSFVRP